MPPERDWSSMRERIIGLGEDSARKSFYPELQQRLLQLEETREHLRVSQENLWSIFNSVHDAILIHDRQGRILEANLPAVAMFGVTREAMRELTVLDLSHLDPAQGEPRDQLQALLARMDREGFLVCEWKAKRPADGALIDVEVALRPATWYGGPVVAAVVRDITARKRVESQLLQAQKLESLGQLAGGLAHDTNNMLGVIIGYSELLLEDPRVTNGDFRGHLEQILKAANRSAELARHLLAFARKQTIQPSLIDLNRLVEETQRMLRRLIGENHTMVWKPATTLWNVWLDPAQLSQALVNLVVNARDAIETSGAITLETRNQHVDAGYAQAHPDAVPGDFVVIMVSDTGRGMDAAMLGHIFEPFFTTKEAGRGTGLGLAMVYGIVRQNGGFITVYSTPGVGTTFRLHLPRFLGPWEGLAADEGEGAVAGGTETVLLVEDEEPLLELGRKLLEDAGYRVLAASTPAAALERAAREPGAIHLLATDIVMPGMDGAELRRQLAGLRPSLRSLFLSGYPQEAISAQGILAPGVVFLQKPFSRRDLLLKVREALGDGQR
jgi:PAS domain S-box-containing protein